MPLSRDGMGIPLTLEGPAVLVDLIKEQMVDKPKMVRVTAVKAM
jgi:hypothetical protein